MEILKFPDLLLFLKAREVIVFSAELCVLLDEMYDTMKSNKGMGLAANQVGLRHNMFVMEGPNGRINLVNPKIVEQSKVFANLKEGCLSAPGEFISVPSRAKWVKVEYSDETGELKTAVFSGLYSVCAQHEIEHLQGESYLHNKSIPKDIRRTLAKKWGI